MGKMSGHKMVCVFFISAVNSVYDFLGGFACVWNGSCFFIVCNCLMMFFSFVRFFKVWCFTWRRRSVVIALVSTRTWLRDDDVSCYALHQTLCLYMTSVCQAIPNILLFGKTWNEVGGSKTMLPPPTLFECMCFV